MGERGKRRENNEKKRGVNEGGRGWGGRGGKREKLTLKRLLRDPAKGKSGVLLQTNKSYSVHVCAVCTLAGRIQTDWRVKASWRVCEAQPTVKERKQIFGLLRVLIAAQLFTRKQPRRTKLSSLFLIGIVSRVYFF